MSAVISTLSRLQINGQQYDFQSANYGANEQIADLNGNRGDLSHDVSMFRPGIIRVGGQMRFEPNVASMPLLNTFAMGGASSTLANTALVYEIIADKRGDIFDFASNAVGRCTWAGSQGEPLSMSLDVLGMTETGSASWGSPTAIDTATGPWMFQEMVLTIGGATKNSRTFALTLDNHLDSGRFFNSRTLVSLVRLDRTVTLSLDLPYGDASTVYGSGNAGVAVVAVFTNAGTSDILRFTMGKAIFGKNAPTQSLRSEEMLTISAQCAAVGSTRELIVAYT